MANSLPGPIISVRAFLEDQKGNVLLVKRGNVHYAKGKWALPGGVINVGESPEKSLERIINQKTGLNLENIDFLKYQDSPPGPDGDLHCLNMYFKATALGNIKPNPAYEESSWVPARDLKQYTLAFNATSAIEFYEKSKIPEDHLLWMLVDEAGKHFIPVTKSRLKELQAIPGFFIQLNQDMSVCESVTRKVESILDIIKSTIKRNSEPIIVQTETRTKEYTSILEKMVRKGENGIPRHYTTFDDLSGARAVVSFLKDIYTVKNALLQFGEIKLKEEEDYIKNPKDSGYRGLHLTLEVPMPGVNFMPRCEVQIRTVHQHSWSIATHELTYKKIAIPLEYHAKLFRLSQSLAESDIIKEQLRHDIEHLND